MPSAVRRSRSCSWARTPGSKVRIVPIISTFSGTMLLRTPPWIAPTVSTEGVSVASTWRDTIVCQPSTIWLASTTGSTPAHGRAPCVCRPSTFTRKLSDEAMMPCSRQAIVPTGSGITCRPKIASTFGLASAPSSIISGAPPRSPMGEPSSAGWKMNTRVPGISARCRLNTSAAPMSIATWLSWPQACITPTSWPL